MRTTFNGHPADIVVETVTDDFGWVWLLGNGFGFFFSHDAWLRCHTPPEHHRPIRDDELAMLILQHGKTSQFPFGDKP